MRKVICAALVLAVCSVASAADDWRDRFAKFHEVEKEKAKEAAKKVGGKLKDKEADLDTAKRGKDFIKVMDLQSHVKQLKVEAARATEYAKWFDAKDWKPTRIALRNLSNEQFVYRVNAPVKVLQVIDGGAVVQWTTETSVIDGTAIPDGQRYFLKGLPEAAEGKTYKVTGYIERTGTVKYTAAAGDERTVVALELHGK